MSPVQAEAEATLFRAFLAYGLDQDALQDLNSFSGLLEEFLEAVLYDGHLSVLNVSAAVLEAAVAQAGKLYDDLP